MPIQSSDKTDALFIHTTEARANDWIYTGMWTNPVSAVYDSVFYIRVSRDVYMLIIESKTTMRDCRVSRDSRWRGNYVSFSSGLQ